MIEIKNRIKNQKFIEDQLFLLEGLSENFGFFYQNSTVYFLKKSSGIGSDLSISTQYLDMSCNVFISNISEKASFVEGYYDFLSFKGDIDSLYFQSFYNLCKSYSLNDSATSFYDFFSSVARLFIPEENSYKNLIGVIGELTLIKILYDEFGVILSKNWCMVGSESKFDYSFKHFNLELKSTTKSEKSFRIKHNQLFNNQKNYLVLMNLIETGNGHSLESLYSYYTNEQIFANDIEFQIKLSKVFLKFQNYKDRARSFLVDDVAYYDVDQMEQIQDIPSSITKIEYDYDFSDFEGISVNEIINRM